MRTLVRKGVVAIGRFFHPERQGEESHFRKWFADMGFKVCDMPAATPFEGEGDALFETDGSRLWAEYGVRTMQSTHRLWYGNRHSVAPGVGQMAHDTLFPSIPNGGITGNLIFLVIAIVGTPSPHGSCSFNKAASLTIACAFPT